MVIFGASGDLTKRKLIPALLQSGGGQTAAGTIRHHRLRQQRFHHRDVSRN
jgi:glucose-6-phosphate 1-dehydrogenase